MRLWTLHPRYLDAKGLVAVWREALLAQKVLQGQTRGYRHHPQLERFRVLENPVAGVAAYLEGIYAESLQRGYHFNSTKISTPRYPGVIEATEGQLLYEWLHLKRKLAQRDPERYAQYVYIAVPTPHPLFQIVPGGVQSWERA